MRVCHARARLSQQDLVVGEAELLSAEGDVADAVRLLHLAGGQAALVARAAHEQRLAVLGLAAGERVGRDVAPAGGRPAVGAAD